MAHRVQVPVFQTFHSIDSRPRPIGSKGERLYGFSNDEFNSTKYLEEVKSVTKTAADEIREQEEMQQKADYEELCKDLLKTGNVRAYIDFYFIVHRKSERDPHSGKALKEDSIPNKHLQMLKNTLASAEESRNRKEYDKSYEQCRRIARYFGEAKDYACERYFFSRAVEDAELSRNPELLARGLLQLGQTLCSSSSWEEAVEVLDRALGITIDAGTSGLKIEVAAELLNVHSHLSVVKLAHAQSMQQNFIASQQSNNGSGFQKTALGGVRANTTLDDFVLEEIKIALKHCEARLECASLVGDSEAECDALLSLGEAYLLLGRNEEAVALYKNYISRTASGTKSNVNGNTNPSANAVRNEIHVASDSKISSAKAALAKAMEASGDLDGAVAELESLVNSDDPSGSSSTIQAHACLALGSLFVSQGDDERALELLEHFYDLAQRVHDRQMVETARVLVGIARGKEKLPTFAKVINSSLQKLLDWKVSRHPLDG